MKMRRIAAILLILGAAGAVRGDVIRAKGIRHGSATITDAKDAHVHFTSNRAPFVVPVAQVQVIAMEGNDKFNRAEELLRDKSFAKAVAAYDSALKGASGWKERLIRYRRLTALDQAEQIDRAAAEWVWIVDGCADKTTALKLRPARLGKKGSKENARAIALLEEKLAKVADKGYEAGIKGLLLDLYQREGNEEKAAKLAAELLGTPATRPDVSGNGPPPAVGDLDQQLKGAAVILLRDPAAALAGIEENLDRYSPAQLSRALLLAGKAQVALAEKAEGEPKTRLLLKGGLNFMRVWTYYPGAPEAPEALYLAGKVNASLPSPNLAAARAAYQRVRTMYRKSPFAQKAQDALAALKGGETKG